jgi:hypothetical protein
MGSEVLVCDIKIRIIQKRAPQPAAGRHVLYGTSDEIKALGDMPF